MAKLLDSTGLAYFWGKVKDYVDSRVGGVTGVKGNSESSYRTGNVNLTAANIGALTGSDVKDNLTSTDTNKPLSANQGKVLKGILDNVGTVQSTSASKNLAAGTRTAMCTLSLGAGVWVITGDIHFASNSADSRKMCVVNCSTGSYSSNYTKSDWYTELNATLIVSLSATATITLNGESTTALNGCTGILRAVRIK